MPGDLGRTRRRSQLFAQRIERRGYILILGGEQMNLRVRRSQPAGAVRIGKETHRILRPHQHHMARPRQK